MASAVALVSAGVGLAIVPHTIYQTHLPADIAAVDLTHPAIVRTLVAVTRKGVPLAPLAADLLARIEQALELRPRDSLSKRPRSPRSITSITHERT